MRWMARRITRSSSRSPFTTVCSLYYSADGGELLILPLVNGFHDGLHPVLLSGWQKIVHNSPRQRLSPRLRAILLPDGTVLLVLPLVVRFHEGCVVYCSADGTVLLILPLVNGVPDVSRAVLHSGWKRIARSAVCRRLSRFAHCIAQRRAADCSFFRRQLSRRFARCIAHSSGRQRLSQCFACCITQLMAAHCSFFRWPTVFTVCVLYCSVDGGGFLILPFVNGFHDGLHAVLLSGWQQISHTSPRQWLSRRLRAILLHGWHRVARSSSHRRLLWFARRIAQRMVADCVFFSRQLLSQSFSRHIA